jgi:hypothetical protein
MGLLRWVNAVIVNDCSTPQNIDDVCPATLRETIVEAESMTVGRREQMPSGVDGALHSSDG